MIVLNIIIYQKQIGLLNKLKSNKQILNTERASKLNKLALFKLIFYFKLINFFPIDKLVSDNLLDIFTAVSYHLILSFIFLELFFFFT